MLSLRVESSRNRDGWNERAVERQLLAFHGSFLRHVNRAIQTLRSCRKHNCQDVWQLYRAYTSDVRDPSAAVHQNEVELGFPTPAQALNDMATVLILVKGPHIQAPHTLKIPL